MANKKKKKFVKPFISMTLAVSLVVTGTYVASPWNGTKIKVTAKTKETPVLQLRYDEPATDWESQALPIGNGKMGAMVFGGVDTEKIQVNEETVWSGGPGANASYTGGDNNYSADTVHEALQNVRNSLQEMVTEFANTKAAYFDADGKLITADYTDLTQDSAFMSDLDKLKGVKTNFGTYQTLSNIYLTDPDYAAAKVVEIETNADTGDSLSERTSSLFDNDSGTKWYTGSGFNKTATVQWKYDRTVSIAKYTMVSGNDEQSRDPAEWVLYGSNNGTDFTKLDEQSGVTFSSRKQSKEFTLTTSGAYLYYKIEFTQNAKGTTSEFQLSDINLDGAAGAASEYSNYMRVSDINRAVEEVQYEQNGVTFEREYFMNNPSNVMVAKLTASEKGKIDRDISLGSEQTKTEFSVDEANSTITMTGQPADQKSNGLKFAQQLKVIADGGTVTKSDSSTLSVRGADSVILIMSAGTNYQVDSGTTYNYFESEEPIDEVEECVDAAVNKGYDKLYSEHVADYKNLFDRVSLNIGAVDVPDKMTDDLLADYGKSNTEEEDRYLETLFYQYGRYLLIASSRENGQLPANLQGIWAQGLSPAWNSDYHTNINLQMNYWLAEQTNLTECHDTVIDYVNSMVEKGKVTAQKYYCQQDGSDVRGWVIHHENNIWGNTNPSNWTTAFYFPAAAAWMCQDIWDKYQFNDDKEFLAENYDTMLQAALFWVDNLWEDERDGKLVANPSYSPEHGTFSIGCSSDQAIIWELFEEVKNASEVLGKANDAEVKEVIEAQKNLYMPTIGLGGQLAEWKDETTLEVTNSDSHRHQNHLSVLHPGTYLVAGRSEWDDEMMEAAKVTLNKRGDGGTGWSKAWKINMWARLRDGDRAKKLLSEQLTGSTLKNLFDTHAPYQIDGNFGATSGVTEMLLQSQGDYIEPMAALPSDWAAGSVSGIKARGNFAMDMDWEDGVVSEFNVTSNSGNECKIKYNGISNLMIYDRTAMQYITPEIIDEDTISFPTTKGSTYMLAEHITLPTATPVASAKPSDTPVATQNPSTTQKPNETPSEDEAVQVGTTITKGKVSYKVTSSTTVEYKKSKENKKSVVVPNTIRQGEKTYRVTSISKNALSGKKALTKVVIGKNIKKIGSKAFANCKKLKSVLIKSKKLKTVGKSAFRNTAKKMKVKMPKSCKKRYKKLLKKSGISSKAKYI